jgi:hypothetical protein
MPRRGPGRVLEQYGSNGPNVNTDENFGMVRQLRQNGRQGAETRSLSERRIDEKNLFSSYHQNKPGYSNRPDHSKRNHTCPGGCRYCGTCPGGCRK